MNGVQDCKREIFLNQKVLERFGSHNKEIASIYFFPLNKTKTLFCRFHFKVLRIVYTMVPSNNVRWSQWHWVSVNLSIRSIYCLHKSTEIRANPNIHFYKLFLWLSANLSHFWSTRLETKFSWSYIFNCSEGEFLRNRVKQKQNVVIVVKITALTDTRKSPDIVFL